MAQVRLIVLAPVILTFGFAHPAFAQAPVKRFITPDGKRPSGLFAPAVMVGETLYIAGKGDYRPDAPFPEKVENCLNEIRKTLQLAGLDMKHVVKSFAYLEDPGQYAEFNKHYAKFFENNPPARTTLGVPQVPGDSRVEVTCIAYSDLDETRRLGEVRPGLPFSPGVLAGETLYISGKGDQLADGTHPASFAEQVRQAMRNVETTLKQAGLSFKNVVMSHVFLDKYDNLDETNKVYNEFFEDGDEPACSTVFVDWIPGGSHVEVTCIATTNLEARKVVKAAGNKPGPGQAAVQASAAVWAGNTLYLSGLTGTEHPGGSQSDDLAPQVHGMGKNHTALLETAGLKSEDIVAGWVYLRHMEDYQPMNKIYREYYSKGPGVRTCLMPNSSYEKNSIRVRGSFIAARTRPAE